MRRGWSHYNSDHPIPTASRALVPTRTPCKSRPQGWPLWPEGPVCDRILVARSGAGCVQWQGVLPCPRSLWRGEWALIDDLIHRFDVGEQLSNHTNELRQAEPASELPDPTLWGDRVRDALAQRSDAAAGYCRGRCSRLSRRIRTPAACRACGLGCRSLSACARVSQTPPEALCAWQSRSLLTALAYGQQRQFSRAWTMLCAEGIEFFPAAVRWFVGAGIMLHWLRERLAGDSSGAGAHRAARGEDAFDPANPLAKPPAHACSGRASHRRRP